MASDASIRVQRTAPAWDPAKSPWLGREQPARAPGRDRDRCRRRQNRFWRITSQRAAQSRSASRAAPRSPRQRERSLPVATSRCRSPSQPHVGLRERGRVVHAVADHRDARPATAAGRSSRACRRAARRRSRAPGAMPACAATACAVRVVAREQHTCMPSRVSAATVAAASGARCPRARQSSSVPFSATAITVRNFRLEPFALGGEQRRLGRAVLLEPRARRRTRAHGIAYRRGRRRPEVLGHERLDAALRRAAPHDGGRERVLAARLGGRGPPAAAAAPSRPARSRRR